MGRYNGTQPWTATTEVGNLIGAVGPALAPCQPAQRHHVVDEQRVRADDLPWRNLMAAVIGLETSRSPADLARVANVLREALAEQADDELRRAFVDWVRQLMERLVPGREQLPREMNLEEVRVTLEERVSQWPKQWFEDGVRKGVEQGLEQGLEQQRLLLRRLAVARFGSGTGQRLGQVLASVRDVDWLAEVGDWILGSDTADELLAHANAVLGRRI